MAAVGLTIVPVLDVTKHIWSQIRAKVDFKTINYFKD